ncbi:MAG: Gfo/Idh/MocA family oxidoreductase [Pyrinomonadaceae bacterium]|nr:Gfo/Idh/MocA family oxidoreductase [Pyrinomonadaceae bacterium]
MSKTVGIGIIGTGFARRVQIPAFLACANTRIASVASGSLENAKETAKECGAEHFTADWRETAARDDVDLVCITTPPNLHREMTLAAIEHGKHILCEKPMAMNVAEVLNMIEAAKDKPLLTLIDHELRFQPGRQAVYKMLRDNVIGKVRHAKFIFQAPHRGDPNIAWNWWSDASVGGGALGAIASHIIDSFNWFLGTDVASVTCQLQTHIKQRPRSDGEMRAVTSDDESNMLLRFADSELTDDATGLVSVSMTEYPKYKNRLEFYGSDGSIRIDHIGDVFLARAGDDDWSEIKVPLAANIPGVADTGFARGFMDFAPHIIDAITSGKVLIEHAATFEDGLRVQRVLDAARESNASGRRIDVGGNTRVDA